MAGTCSTAAPTGHLKFEGDPDSLRVTRDEITSFLDSITKFAMPILLWYQLSGLSGLRHELLPSMQSRRYVVRCDLQTLSVSSLPTRGATEIRYYQNRRLPQWSATLRSPAHIILSAASHEIVVHLTDVMFRRTTLNFSEQLNPPHDPGMFGTGEIRARLVGCGN